ncbi:hypothetical protein [Lyngbya sp. PCC 8106]|uniref:hypothetical protein n=1 Tax=Lyngbya sp. (strain PCC 8106) TaxID=313612 RepID=UPI0000EA9939|nr:hypothetical protein [Lyngbya sp. PCC 8106]EAW35219.1 hypothetical protein L8106_13930 [Lyngbya sp. PCC 8106]
MRFSKNRRTTIIQLVLITLLVAIGIGILIKPAQGQSDLQEFVDSIESVEQVKEDLRQTLKFRDECGVGSCWNTTSTGICETVAALDVQINGQIIGGMSSAGSDGNIPISSSDLELMKLIFSQCKPTNYQYWNWPMMLHVLYVPSDEVDQQVRQGLGLSPRKTRP